MEAIGGFVTSSGEHQRKYVLTKLKPGDYLLPSNDGERIWRIAKYTDGPSSGFEDWPRDREVWGLYTSSLLNNSYGQLDRRAMDLDWAEWTGIGRGTRRRRR